MDIKKIVKGKKFDQQKNLWHLLPMKQLDEVVAVLTFGAKIYGENDWKHFVIRDKNELRYFSAALRHLMKWHSGEKLDIETNKKHLAHAICCLLFCMWKDDQCKK